MNKNNNIMFNKIVEIRCKLLEQFKKVRTDAISEMFDNADEHGIYPTGKFFNTLDSFFIEASHTIVEETLKEVGKLVDKRIEEKHE